MKTPSAGRCKKCSQRLTYIPKRALSLYLFSSSHVINAMLQLHAHPRANARAHTSRCCAVGSAFLWPQTTPFRQSRHHHLCVVTKLVVVVVVVVVVVAAAAAVVVIGAVRVPVKARTSEIHGYLRMACRLQQWPRCWLSG